MSFLQDLNLQIREFWVQRNWHDLGWQTAQAHRGQEYFAEKKREEEKWKAREHQMVGDTDAEESSEYR